MKWNESPCTTVVLVGHCGPDAWLLRNALARALPQARIVAVDDDRDLRVHFRPDRLLLVNRVLDGAFANDDGIQLIRDAASAPDPPRLMLISNYADAQAAAIEAGALPGFGKKNVYDEATVKLLRDACAAAAQDSKNN
jgi:hypothetical protein